MTTMLLKAAVAFVPVAALLAYSVARFVRRQTVPLLLQVLGAGCLLVVVLTHVAEALHLMPAMRWGEPTSAGHYLDLVSAVLGVGAGRGASVRRRALVAVVVEAAGRQLAETSCAPTVSASFLKIRPPFTTCEPAGSDPQSAPPSTMVPSQFLHRRRH